MTRIRPFYTRHEAAKHMCRDCLYSDHNLRLRKKRLANHRHSQSEILSVAQHAPDGRFVRQPGLGGPQPDVLVGVQSEEADELG